MSKKFYIIMVVVMVGIVLRIASFSWNQYIHGDVGQYSIVAESIAHRGDFLLSSDTTNPFFYSLQKTSGRFLEHNPLWPLLGSALVKIFHSPGFIALKILSLLSGIALLFAVFLLGQKVLDWRLGLFATALCSIAYLLIDFSANGSFYIFQALLYILFILVLLHEDLQYRNGLLGLLMGAGLLLNQQTIILVVSYLIYECYQRWHDRNVLLKNIGSALLFPILFYALWALRNYILFGSPSPQTDLAYIWSKLGVASSVSNGIISYSITPAVFVVLLKKVFSFWLPHNLYFINRKLFIEAPLVYLLSLAMMGEVALNRLSSRFAKLYPILLVVLFHTAISAAWPIAKFRYLVPLIPLVIVLGGYYIFAVVKTQRIQYALVASSLLLMATVSMMTYWSNPAHTDYYDGSITTDNFGKQGELEFINNVSRGSLED